MPIPRFSSKLAILASLLVIVSISGCVPWGRGLRSLDDTVTDWRDYVWGKRAFYQRYGRDSSKPFLDGFLEGYHEMLQGGDGCLPVVPPKRYWGWRYQSAGGQGAVNDWFNGFRAGVEAAKEDGLDNLSCIPISAEYNGINNVPIEGIPVDEGIPLDGTEANGPADSPQIPGAADVETGSRADQPAPKSATRSKPRLLKEKIPKKKIALAGKSASAVRKASNTELVEQSTKGATQSVPLGTETTKVSPMIKANSDEPLAMGARRAVSKSTISKSTASEQPKPMSTSLSAPAVPTSRRNLETPLSSVQLPVISKTPNMSFSLPLKSPLLPTRR